MPLIDFAEVRKLVSLETVMELLGLGTPQKMGRNSYGRCPLGCSSHPRCCSFDFQRGLWNCWKCHQGGDQLNLYAARLSTTVYTAALELCQRAGIQPPAVAQQALPFPKGDSLDR